MIAFIDEHKDRTSCGLRWGIEPICGQLPIAPATYYAARNRTPSAREVRDCGLRPKILKVWEQNLCVYGADKVWDQLNKDGIGVARCTVERLMADMGLQGCRRGRIWIRTTVSDDTLDRPADLVKRQFWASAPNVLWLADLTYVKTSTGWVHVAFIIDVYSRMIVGWQASRSLRTDLAIDALEMAMYNRGRTDSLEGLIHHSDRGVQLRFKGSKQHFAVEQTLEPRQYTSDAFAEACGKLGITQSMGRFGSAHDNAAAESFFSTLEHERLSRRTYTTRVEARQDVARWIDDFHNRRRKHSANGMKSPINYETEYHKLQSETAKAA